MSTDDKLRYIELLVDAGLRDIEATSFVSPRAIPQLADADALVARLPRRPGVRYPVLVPNERGLARAEAAGVDAIAVFTAATDAFTTHNIGMTVEASLAAFAPVLDRAGRARLVATRLRVDRLRLPVHGARRPARRGRAWRAGSSTWVRTRSASATPSGSASRTRSPRSSRWPRTAASTSSGRRTTSTTRAGPRWRTSRWRSPPGFGPSIRRPVARVAARTRRAPPAISRPRTSYTCSTPPATTTASRSTACWPLPASSPRPWARRSPRRSARPVAGMRPTGAARGRDPD